MQYQQLIEKNILDVQILYIQYLTDKIPDFKMQVFSHLLASRMEQIDEELL